MSIAEIAQSPIDFLMKQALNRAAALSTINKSRIHAKLLTRIKEVMSISNLEKKEHDFVEKLCNSEKRQQGLSFVNLIEIEDLSNKISEEITSQIIVTPHYKYKTLEEVRDGFICMNLKFY